MSARMTSEHLQAIQMRMNASKPAPKARMQALGRLKRGNMNQTEAAYEQQLKIRQMAGEVAWYSFDCINLRLAENLHYRCDFFVMLANGQLEAHEVKGVWQDDALAKIKMAAALYPFRFIAVKKKGTTFTEQEF